MIEALRPITLITTCKGRLDDLMRTLPHMLNCGAHEVIVVDYSCPQHTGEWVALHHPIAKVVHVMDDSGFNLGNARNQGALRATSEWICFIDADVLPLPGFSAWLDETLLEGHFYRVHQDDAPGQNGIWGTVICPRKAFQEIGGYDAAITGYGGDDTDLYERLQAWNIQESRIPPALLTCIETPTALKTAFYAIKDTNISLKIGHLYRYIKYNIFGLMNREMSLPARQRLYRYCVDAVMNPGLAKPFDMEIRSELRQHGMSVTCKIAYTVAPISGQSPADSQRMANSVSHQASPDTPAMS